MFLPIANKTIGDNRIPVVTLFEERFHVNFTGVNTNNGLGRISL